MRAAVYSGTKNVYKQMIASAKSLLIHSNVEKIYFLIEDDEFPYELPPEIECRNISNQTYFRHDGPNFKNFLTYMVLIRVAYTKIFPDLDRILTIDIDTIVNENISDLWDLDLTDYYLAAVEEIEVTKKEGSYINMGVAMLNLKKIREEHKDDELIKNLNTFWYRWGEQDAINQLFRGHIKILPADYNACWQSGEPQHEKITHFAGIYGLENKPFPQFKYYENLPLSEIERNIQDKFTLDIIIPTYKNKEGLRKTLNSIKVDDDVHIIVVDDCSELDYSDILQDYPFIEFHQLETNVGPGMARQYAIDHSHGTYFMFLDTGDYFYDDGLDYILAIIKSNTYIKLYSFAYVYDKNNVLADNFDNKAIGKVYKRSFIEMYGIRFCPEGSYADEDYGFNRTVVRILQHLKLYKFAPMHKHVKIPVLYEHYDKNSLTKKDNGDFFYTKMIPGLAINDLHAIQTLSREKIDVWRIIEEICYTLAYEYYLFLCIVHERPDLLYETWDALRDYYFKSYYIYSKFAEPTLLKAFSHVAFPQIKKRSTEWDSPYPINILRFVYELENYEMPPERYFTGD